MRPITGFDDRLENWRKCLLTYPKLAQCGSAEGNWRSPQHWHPVGPRPVLDLNDAWIVEQAWRALQNPYRRLIQLYHIRRRDWKTASVKAGIPRRSFPEVYKTALFMLRQTLDTEQDSPIVSANNQLARKVHPRPSWEGALSLGETA